jgi:hypothetical protein
MRLLALATQKPRVVARVYLYDISRLGREQIETAYALKVLIKAGVEV